MEKILPVARTERQINLSRDRFRRSSQNRQREIPDITSEQLEFGDRYRERMKRRLQRRQEGR